MCTFKVKDDDKVNLKLEFCFLLHCHSPRDISLWYWFRVCSSIGHPTSYIAVVYSEVLHSHHWRSDCLPAIRTSSAWYFQLSTKVHRSSVVSSLEAKLPYGMVEVGRQWLFPIVNWRTETYNVNWDQGMEQLYRKKKDDIWINIIVAKFVEYFHTSVTTRAKDIFLAAFAHHVNNRHTVNGEKLKFLGCWLTQNPSGDIELSMSDYMNINMPFEQTKTTRKEIFDKDTEGASHLQHASGFIATPGSGFHFAGRLYCIWAEHHLWSLHVSHTIKAASMAGDLIRLELSITFSKANDII